MCKQGAPCGCGGTSGGGDLLGLAFAALALAAAVSAAMAVIEHFIALIAVIAAVAAVAVVAYLAVRVRHLTRPAKPRQPASRPALPRRSPQALPVAAPRAIEAPRIVTGTPLPARNPHSHPRSRLTGSKEASR